MAPDDLDELERGLDPTARFIVAYLRQENAQLREQIAFSAKQLAANAERIAELTEQVADFKRRLFGKRSERIPTVQEELRRRVDPDELTVDGTRTVDHWRTSMTASKTNRQGRQERQEHWGCG